MPGAHLVAEPCLSSAAWHDSRIAEHKTIVQSACLPINAPPATTAHSRLSHLIHPRRATGCVHTAHAAPGMLRSGCIDILMHIIASAKVPLEQIGGPTYGGDSPAAHGLCTLGAEKSWVDCSRKRARVVYFHQFVDCTRDGGQARVPGRAKLTPRATAVHARAPRLGTNPGRVVIGKV